MSKEPLALIPISKDIWRHPRQTIRRVVDYDPKFGQREIILTLSAVSGLLALPQGFDMALLEAVLNFILLIASIYSMAALLWITGKPMGGKAGFQELNAAMVWPMVPAIWGTLIAFLLLNTEQIGDIVQGLFYLYSFHIMVETVAEVQGFSSWRSFFSQLLALILSILPFLFFWPQVINTYRKLFGF